METVFDELSKALESKQHNAGAGVTLLALAGALAICVGIAIAIALLARASTSDIPQPPHNSGMWGERHAIG